MAQSISVANTGAFSQAISRDYDKIFFGEYFSEPEEYRQIANVRSMDGAYERRGEMIGLTALQEIGEGQPIPFENFQQGNEKTIYPADYGLAFAITENMWDDDQTGHMKKAFQELGKAAARVRELKFWDLLNSGFVTTVRTGMDAAALFSSHTRVDGVSTFANYAATASALSVTSLQTALNVFENMTDERNNPSPITPRILVVSPSLRFDAETILKSEYNPDNAMQQVNTVGNKGIQFMVCHYLTSTTAWYLLADKSKHDLEFINRKQLQLKRWDEPNKRIAVFQASMRFTTDFYQWYGTYGNAGA